MADKRLLAYYDLRCAPLSFDFAGYLSVVVGHALKYGYSKISLWIYAPNYRKSNQIEQGYPAGYEDRKVRNVIYALAGLVPMIDDVMFTKSGIVAHSPDSFPVGYNLADPALVQGSARALMPCTPAEVGQMYADSGNPRIFQPTRPGLTWVQSYLGETPYVTLTTRHTSHNPYRNARLEDFYQVYRDLAAAFPALQFVAIPDQDDLLANYDASRYDWRLCPEASLDLELRMALYSRAALNITWTSGPTSLLNYSDANYILFGIWNETSNVSSRGFFERKGPRFGAQLPWAIPNKQIIDWTHAPEVTPRYMVERATDFLKQSGY
jgi:hypothetical protein